MVRNCLAGFLLLCGASLCAQEEPAFSYKSMLKGSATLAPGFMLAQAQNNIYVHGHLEYFPEEKVSLRGEAFWFTGAQQKPQLLNENSSFLFGGLYHFHKKRFDYFIGLQTGASFTKPNDTYDTIPGIGPQTLPGVYTYKVSYKIKVLPLVSPVTGISFYPGKYVNFFLELRYVNGRYFGYNSGRLSMDEIRISAGLGFQIHTRKS